eukprot:CAMPEP_0183709322 /NCGR_PEP_ID=MMETSP0737-20130205/5394_1 /TAXON_ID=385413 /ORGANISM="Thalassiosira miniscula, Strain CCMP1093" /LENGTH=137 /DNA_ID=CAMNT_0025937395 /DNA_START=170 /DNA_END=583 /DNA_ORIENTATION=+
MKSILAIFLLLVASSAVTVASATVTYANRHHNASQNGAKINHESNSDSSQRQRGLRKRQMTTNQENIDDTDCFGLLDTTADEQNDPDEIAARRLASIEDIMDEETDGKPTQQPRRGGEFGGLRGGFQMDSYTALLSR